MAVAAGGGDDITKAGDVRDFNTGKKRRLLSRSDKEIIDEIDYRLDYRTGWPKPLPVLPVVVTHLPNESSIVDNIEEVEAYIATILKAQRVLWCWRFYFAYLHKPRIEPGVEDISLIVNSPQSAPYWVNALKEIRKYFMKKDIHYRIEFRNHDLLNPDTLTILPDNPIVDLWNEFYMEKVLAVIKNTAWQPVNVFHCGFGATREECPVTVIIRAWDAEQEIWWSKIIPTLRLMCSLKIRLLSATSITATGLDVTASELPAKAFKGPVDIGASIGIRGQKGGGTLGGMIELEFPDGSKGNFGLTNHHVVLEDALQAATANNVAFLPSNQLAINGNLVMMSPAETDTAIKLEAIREDIEIRQEVIDGNGTPGFKQQVEEFGNELKRPLLEKHENSIKTSKAIQTDILKANPVLGHVAASSGYRTTMDSEGCSWGMDWALIRLSEDRPMENRIVDIEPDALMLKYEEDMFEFWSTKELRPGSSIAKKGKTTNWTKGTVNAIKANLRMSRKESGGEFNLHASRDISAWVAHAPKDRRSFCSAGDNGSLVFSIDTGNVVGLLFGSDPGGDGKLMLRVEYKARIVSTKSSTPPNPRLDPLQNPIWHVIDLPWQYEGTEIAKQSHQEKAEQMKLNSLAEHIFHRNANICRQINALEKVQMKWKSIPDQQTLQAWKGEVRDRLPSFIMDKLRQGLVESSIDADDWLKVIQQAVELGGKWGDVKMLIEQCGIEVTWKLRGEEEDQ